MGAPELISSGSGGGGGGISGSGTAGYVAKFTSGTAVGNSLVRDDGTNVSIDASPSVGYKLTVNGDTTIVGRIDALTGSINTLSSRASQNLTLQRDGVTAATVIAGGLIGVGCTDPANTLETYASGASGIRASSDALANIGIFQNSTNAAGSSLTFRKARGTRATPSAVNSGDTIGTVQFSAYGTGGNVVSSIASSVVAYTSATDISSNLTFGTSPSGSAAAVTRMTIDQAGNVGIGTASPASPLHVGGGNNTGIVTTGPAAYVATNGATSLVVRDATNGIESFLYAGSSVVLAGAASAHSYHIRTNNTSRLIVSANTGIVTVGATAGTTSNTLDVSTGGWGVKLPTAPANGDANTLDCYAEADWTPVDKSGASLAITFTNAKVTRIGRVVHCCFVATYPATASALAAKISLPFPCTSGTPAAPIYPGTAAIGFNDSTAASMIAQVVSDTTNGAYLYFHNPAVDVPNSTLSTKNLQVSVTYQIY
jgi:hypothetical protein